MMTDTRTRTALRILLGRVRRLDPDALVRLRPDTAGGRFWALLPFGVLATKELPITVPEDITVKASDLYERTGGPIPMEPTRGLPRHDGQWRGGTLPDPTAPIIERIAAHECHRIGDDAAAALRTAQRQAVQQQRSVGERKLRDTLLDHVALTITVGADRYEVPVRLVVGLLRMGFAPEGEVRVRRSGRRLGLEGVHGAVWAAGGGLPLLM